MSNRGPSRCVSSDLSGNSRLVSRKLAVMLAVGVGAFGLATCAYDILFDLPVLDT